MDTGQPNIFIPLHLKKNNEELSWLCYRQVSELHEDYLFPVINKVAALFFLVSDVSTVGNTIVGEKENVQS